MSLLNRKVKVALLSVASNTVLIILKIIAGVMSGSVSIISEAIHSSMDLVASVIALFSVKFASKPADRDHPYGHGKIENVSGVIEGLLIFVAAFFIVSEAVQKIQHPTHIKEAAYIGIIVMLISAIVNTVVSRKLYKIAKEEDSVALEADALHLKTDVYTSVGVALGLILIQITNQPILDPIVAILVALLIIKESWNLCKSAFSPLLDIKLSDAEEGEVKEVLEKYNCKIIDFHELRTRKSGHMRYIDFHLTVNKDLTVEESHGLSDDIENDIMKKIKNTSVTIHIEPGEIQQNQTLEDTRESLSDSVE